MSKRRRNLPFLGRIAIRYWYQTGVVSVPMIQKQNGTNTNPCGTGTHYQNRIGTGTDHSGTGTDTPNNPGFVPLHG